MFGFLNINKPIGLTSRDVVTKVQRLVSRKYRRMKVGHAGTLDPLASGVLIVAMGQATRLINEVQNFPKRYRGTFLLGQSSDSDDLECEVTRHDDLPIPSQAQIEEELPRWIGTIEQVPPIYSAVKVQGRRAYQEARKGKEVILAPKPVEIHSLQLTRLEFPEVELDIECGSGTYIRSLGRDIALALGTRAVMSDLVRTSIGPFNVEEAIEFEQLDELEFQDALVPPIVALSNRQKVLINQEQETDLFNGCPIGLSDDCGLDLSTHLLLSFVNRNERLIGLGEWDEQEEFAKPTRMFPRNK